MTQCQLFAGILQIGPAKSAEATPSEKSQGMEAKGSVPSTNGFVGHLWKRIPPSLFRFRQYQWRKIILEDGKLSWAEAGDPPKENKGVVDFITNVGCEVVAVEGDEAKFIIRPEGGMWTMGDFTGADKGREFTF